MYRFFLICPCYFSTHTGAINYGGVTVWIFVLVNLGALSGKICMGGIFVAARSVGVLLPGSMMSPLEVLDRSCTVYFLCVMMVKMMDSFWSADICVVYNAANGATGSGFKITSISFLYAYVDTSSNDK